MNEGDDPLAFEREKWAADVAFRRQELEIKSREEDRLRVESRRSRWLNPLVLAVLAAGAAALGNIAVTQINNQQQANLETIKENGERLLQAINTGGDPDKAAANLQFLLDSGLIADQTIVGKLQTYLINRKPGQGAALASVASPNTFGGDISADQIKSLLQSGFTLGVDLTKYQGNPDFTAMAVKNVEFAYVKASEGATILNPLLAAQAKGAEDAKIKVGLYHILDPHGDVTSQFKPFADALSSVHWDLPPAVDIGDRPGTGNDYINNVQKFCDLVENQFHVKPILYAGEATPRPDGYSLWIAAYNQAKRPPKGYLIWQISSRGVSGDATLSGIDLNVFKGGLDQLLVAATPKKN